jgi:hypothetical protein
MKKLKYLFLFFLFIIFPTYAIENLKLKEIYIYSDDAYMLLETSKLISGNKELFLAIPLKTKSHSILNIIGDELDVFVNNPSCTINSITYVDIEDTPDYKDIIEKIKKLRREKEILAIQIKTFENITPQKPLVDEDLKYISEKLNQLYIKKKELEKKLKKERKKLAFPFKLNIFCPKSQKVNIKVYSHFSYVNMKTYYVISIRPRDKILEIDIRTLFKFPFDLNNVNIIYYGKFQNYTPRVERLYLKAARPKMERTTENTEIGVVFKLSNVSAKADEIIDLLLHKKIFKKVSYSVYIKSWNLKPMLYAKIKSDTDIYPISNAKYYLDGFYIKKGYFDGIHKGEEKELFLATDNKVIVKREVLKNELDEGFFSKEKEVLYKYKITNNHDYKMTFFLEDKIPPKRKKDLEIKPIYKGVSIFKYNKATGKIIYTFEVDGNSTKEFIVGYKQELD